MALPPSLYAQTARPAVATPPLDGGRRADVAIVGGGFTGLSTALHLAEQGAQVVLLEAQEPGWGASGRNGGQVNPGLKYDPDRIEADFGTDLGARMVALSGNAPNAVFDLIRRHQISCEASQSGTLRAAYHAGGLADLRASVAQGLARGHPVVALDAAAMRHATGTGRYLGAMLDRRGGHVNPLGYARGLAQAAQQAGASIHGASPVQQIRRDGGVWQVQTASGIVAAGQVVLATNGYTDDLWPGLRRSIVPVFSGIAASAPLPADLAAAVFPLRASLYELGQVTVYYRLDSENRLLMGGRCAQRDLSGPDALGFLIGYANRLWPALRGIAWQFGWSGQLAVTPDHYPHLHEPAPGVIAALGYNGRGVAMATAMGGQIARRLRGDGIDMPITDLRPIPFHGLWRSAVAARVLYGQIRDRLGV